MVDANKMTPNVDWITLLYSVNCTRVHNTPWSIMVSNLFSLNPLLGVVYAVKFNEGKPAGFT